MISNVSSPSTLVDTQMLIGRLYDCACFWGASYVICLYALACNKFSSIYTAAKCLCYLMKPYKAVLVLLRLG